MSNDLVNRNAQYVARYQDEDGYRSFAAEGAPGIVGKRLNFTKGDFTIGGRDRVDAPKGARYLVIMPDCMRGLVKWGEHGITDAHVGRVSECYRPPHRGALSDPEESSWPTGQDGRPRDPWQRYFSIHLVELAVPHGSYTFTGSSWGMQNCMQAICNDYVDQRHEHEGYYPVVELDVYNKPHKEYHIVKEPRLKVVGWAMLDEVTKGKKASAGIAPLAAVTAATTAKAAAKAGIAAKPAEPEPQPSSEALSDDEIVWN
jgi:hypothetical protein